MVFLGSAPLEHCREQLHPSQRAWQRWTWYARGHARSSLDWGYIKHISMMSNVARTWWGREKGSQVVLPVCSWFWSYSDAREVLSREKWQKFHLTAISSKLIPVRGDSGWRWSCQCCTVPPASPSAWSEKWLSLTEAEEKYNSPRSWRGEGPIFTLAWVWDLASKSGSSRAGEWKSWNWYSFSRGSSFCLESWQFKRQRKQTLGTILKYIFTQLISNTWDIWSSSTYL